MLANRIFHHRVFININYISENMSRVEHILILLQQAGLDHEKLWETKEKLQEIIQDPSLDQQDREALKEIESDIEERLVEAWEVGFENQLIAESEAHVHNYPVGRGGQAVRGGRGGRGAQADAQVYNYVGLGGRGVGRGGRGGRGGHGGHGGHGHGHGHGHGGHGANAEHGGNGEYGGHGEYGGNSGSNDYRGGA